MSRSSRWAASEATTSSSPEPLPYFTYQLPLTPAPPPHHPPLPLHCVLLLPVSKALPFSPPSLLQAIHLCPFLCLPLNAQPRRLTHPPLTYLLHSNPTRPPLPTHTSIIFSPLPSGCFHSLGQLYYGSPLLGVLLWSQSGRCVSARADT